MPRVEFRLTMPKVGSWDGRWSGDNCNFVKYMNVPKATLKEMGGMDEREHTEEHWTHDFGDGWRAKVTARIMNKGEKRVRSDGFAGYDWMVTSIILYNAILKGKPG